MTNVNPNINITHAYYENHIETFPFIQAHKRWTMPEV